MIIPPYESPTPFRQMWKNYRFKRKATKEYNKEMRIAKIDEWFRLNEVNREKEKLERAGHQEDAPFCDCKYCMVGVDIIEWCKEREIYRQNSWVDASIREEVPTTKQCQICNETMPKWNNQCDACGYVN